MGCICWGSWCRVFASAVCPQVLLLFPATTAEQQKCKQHERFHSSHAAKISKREFSGCKQSWQVKHVDSEWEVKRSCLAQQHAGGRKSPM